jgi:ribosomal protein S18 acetylase RimI-like enzyme
MGSAARAQSTEYSIRPATESDWPWILKGQVEIALQRLDAEEREEQGSLRVEESVRRQVARIRSDEDFATQAFVAKTAAGERAGFIWLAKDQNDATGLVEASLLNQYVEEAHRGRGLGHQLLDTAENWARDQGLPRIALSVGVRNTLGQRLYESLGYEIETLRMSKRLGAEDEAGVPLTSY